MRSVWGRSVKCLGLIAGVSFRRLTPSPLHLNFLFTLSARPLFSLACLLSAWKRKGKETAATLAILYGLYGVIYRGDKARVEEEKEVCFAIYHFEILLYELLELLLSSIHSITLPLIYVKLISYTN